LLRLRLHHSLEIKNNQNLLVCFATHFEIIATLLNDFSCSPFIRFLKVLRHFFLCIFVDECQKKFLEQTSHNTNRGFSMARCLNSAVFVPKHQSSRDKSKALSIGWLIFY
jgi:hypothetical protein